MPGKILLLPSPAKLNLSLRIIGRREDGYHLLQTLFHFIDLHDELYFESTVNGKVCLAGDTLGIPDIDNLVYKAAQALKPYAAHSAGATITLRKRIPTGGGLGGASSNAATTLIALNHLWQCGLSLEQLMETGLSLGADIPVFLGAHTALAEGIGEDLTKTSVKEQCYVLAFPQVNVLTAKIYSDPQLTRNSPRIRIVDLLTLPPQNDFESIVRVRYPLVDSAFKALETIGKPQMSGSGSTIFLPFPSKELAEEALKKIDPDLNPLLCHGHNISATKPAAQAAGITFPDWGVAKW